MWRDYTVVTQLSMGGPFYLLAVAIVAFVAIEWVMRRIDRALSYGKKKKASGRDTAFNEAWEAAAHKARAAAQVFGKKDAKRAFFVSMREQGYNRWRVHRHRRQAVIVWCAEKLIVAALTFVLLFVVTPQLTLGVLRYPSVANAVAFPAWVHDRYQARVNPVAALTAIREVAYAQSAPWFLHFTVPLAQSRPFVISLMQGDSTQSVPVTLRYNGSGYVLVREDGEPLVERPISDVPDIVSPQMLDETMSEFYSSYENRSDQGKWAWLLACEQIEKCEPPPVG